jgi:hypothetical protein
MLFAASLEPLLTAVQKRDVSLVAKVVVWFKENLSDPEPSLLKMAEDESRTLLSGQQQGKAESEEHMHIVSAMAKVLGVQMNENQIADGDWKQAAWDDYFQYASPHLPAAAITLWQNLCACKRPLFGNKVETSWAYYGYLTGAEAEALLSALDAMAETHSEGLYAAGIGEFHEVLVGWLNEVKTRKTDLWLFAA